MTAPRLYLSDTNLISLALKHKMGRLKKPEMIEAADWYDSITSDTKTILSFATVAELKRWIASKKDQADKDRVASVVVPCIESSYLIQSNDAITSSWARIAQKAKDLGKMSTPNPLGSQINDIWIAATAEASNLTLLTCDKAFCWMEGIGISILVYDGKKPQQPALPFELRSIECDEG